MREALRWLIVTTCIFAVPAQARTIAIVPFGEAAKEIEGPMRTALANVEGVRLSSAASTATDVQAAQQVGLACGPQSDECLVKLALFLRVDQLVSFAATRAPEGIAIELILVDAALGRRAGIVNATLGADNRAEQLEEAALLLLAPNVNFGTIAFDVRPAGARIRVDDGPAMSAEQLRVKAGEHVVEVSQDGFQTHKETVTVRPASTTTVSVSLVPAAPQQHKPTGPAASAGAGSGFFVLGAAVAGAGALVMVGGGVAALVLDGILGTPQGTAAEREQILLWERVSAGTAAVGAVALVVGGVMITVAE